MGYRCGDNPPYYLSAYSLACKRGYTGSLDEWLQSLTAYGIALENGFEGSEEAWLKSLIGPRGETGKSAYEYAVEHGYEGTEEEFAERQTSSGKTAYEYAVEGGYKGTVEEFQQMLGMECLPLIGGTMKGAFSMGGYRLMQVGTPTESTDAANKEYVDKIKKDALAGGTMTGPINMNGMSLTGLSAPVAAQDAANKEYVDSKHRIFTGTLTAAGWAGDASPYTQKVTMTGILETDYPHVTPVYPADAAEAAAVQTAAGCVSFAVAVADGILFTCLSAKPGKDIPIATEVNR